MYVGLDLQEFFDWAADEGRPSWRHAAPPWDLYGEDDNFAPTVRRFLTGRLLLGQPFEPAWASCMETVTAAPGWTTRLTLGDPDTDPTFRGEDTSPMEVLEGAMREAYEARQTELAREGRFEQDVFVLRRKRFSKVAA